jgi:hypothetical protein
MGGSGSTGADVTASVTDPSAPDEPASFRRSAEPLPNRSLTPTLEAYGSETIVAVSPLREAD